MAAKTPRATAPAAPAAPARRRKKRKRTTSTTVPSPSASRRKGTPPPPPDRGSKAMQNLPAIIVGSLLALLILVCTCGSAILGQAGQ